MTRVLVALLLLATAADECKTTTPAPPEESPRFGTTGDLLLSTNSPTKDEDPSLLRGRNGALFAAWFSDRGSNSDIYITSTARGTEWGAPVRVTTSADGDFYPNLLQDESGTFHLVWFRWSALFRGHIIHNTSADGLQWDPRTETEVTTASDVDDWVPTIAQAPDGTLLVYFVSIRRNAASAANDIYMTRRSPGASAWTAPIPVSTINSVAEHDHLPFAARTGDRITLVWVRTDLTQPTPWTSSRSDIYAASSPDGITFSPPLKITNDAGAIVHVFPSMYGSQTQEWWIEWLSTRTGTPRVFELPVPLADMYPRAVAENPMVGQGYSHRFIATPTPGVYLAAWVQGPEGSQDIYYRFFRR